MEGGTRRRRPFHAILRMLNLGNQGAKVYNEVECTVSTHLTRGCSIKNMTKVEMLA
jgi:hypothetical protein